MASASSDYTTLGSDGAYLSLDASKVSTSNEPNTDAVRCVASQDSTTRIVVKNNSDGTVMLSPASDPSVFLRLTVSASSGFQPNGSGTASLQPGPGPFTRFIKDGDPAGRFSFESADVRNYFLRVPPPASDGTPSPVNAQWVDPYTAIFVAGKALAPPRNQ